MIKYISSITFLIFIALPGYAIASEQNCSQLAKTDFKTTELALLMI